MEGRKMREGELSVLWQFHSPRHWHISGVHNTSLYYGGGSWKLSRLDSVAQLCSDWNLVKCGPSEEHGDAWDDHMVRDRRDTFLVVTVVVLKRCNSASDDSGLEVNEFLIRFDDKAEDCIQVFRKANISMCNTMAVTNPERNVEVRSKAVVTRLEPQHP